MTARAAVLASKVEVVRGKLTSTHTRLELEYSLYLRGEGRWRSSPSHLWTPTTIRRKETSSAGENRGSAQ